MRHFYSGVVVTDFSVYPHRLWTLINAASRPKRPVVLIDGGSGSGKTTLAHLLVDHAPMPTQLVSLDSLYPGWGGLAEGSRIVVDDVLRPERPGYRHWDWERDEPADWEPLDPLAALVIEGSGCLTAAAAERATFCLWLEVPEDIRKPRALARDGEEYLAHWDEWAAQERTHAETHQPWHLADLILRSLTTCQD